MRFDIITIFPHILDSYFNESLLKKAQKKGLIKIKTHNLRDFTKDKHHKVDDTPYGGGPGMVLKAEPILRAIQFLKGKNKSNWTDKTNKSNWTDKTNKSNRTDKTDKTNRTNKSDRARVILFSLRGKKFDQKVAHRLAKYDQLIFICGRYEGVDERVAQYVADEEISIGDFVLSGGELPAAIIIEAVSRLVPGILGKRESLEELKGTYPVYTKPEVIKIKGKKRRVPKVLLSGDHQKIARWRAGQS